MSPGDISIKTLFKHIKANTKGFNVGSRKDTQSLTQTHTMTETKKCTKSCQRKTAATESAIPGKRGGKKKDVVLIPKGLAGTATYRHKNKTR